MKDAHVEEKAATRRAFLHARFQLGQQERSRIDALIAKQVIGNASFQQADAVFTYVSVGEEVDTRAIIDYCFEHNKLVVAPRCAAGRTMEWYRIHNVADLETGAFGILEPVAHRTHLVHAESFEQPLALVPGLTFDNQGYRVGHGGGYYDGFLAEFAGVSMGLCRSCQISERPVPREPHDLAVRLLATEYGIADMSEAGHMMKEK